MTKMSLILVCKTISNLKSSPKGFPSLFSTWQQHHLTRKFRISLNVDWRMKVYFLFWDCFLSAAESSLQCLCDAEGLPLHAVK